ncbi:MAG: CBS domain-containing protein [Flavobacteriales bacterium]|jgi:CBS domain-containing protein|nr:CBS domain-containing protein [Flavobacteriales bacterium]
MKRREPVSKIMTKDVVTLQINDGLDKAEKLFRQHNMRHIPVVSGDKIEGIISMTDLARISFVDNYDPNNFTVDTSVYDILTLEQVMVKKPETIDVNKTVKDAAELLASREFHALPVVENENLVGIVTSTDLINYLIEQY